MNRKIVLSLSIFVLFFFTTIFGQSKQAVLNVEKENIRIEPNGKKIGELTSDSQILILETKGDWVKIATTGWMWKKSLTELKDQKIYIQASHILVKTKEEATAILQQIMEGSDFAELAKKYSIDEATKVNGGDLGIIAKGDLLPVFDEAAFVLNPGNVSGVVKTPLGYHIIKRTQ